MTVLEISESVKIEREPKDEKILSRRKRYMIFPEGSSMSVAVCSTMGVIGNPQVSIFSFGLNYGFAYELPTNATIVLRARDKIFNIDQDEDEPPSPPAFATVPVSSPKISIQNATSTINQTQFDLLEFLSQMSKISSLVPPWGYSGKYTPNKMDSNFNNIIHESRKAKDNLQIDTVRQQSYSPYYTKPMLQRRYRRDLYNKMEIIMNK